MRALWITLLAAGSLAFSRAPTDRSGFDRAANTEARDSSGPGDSAVVASTLRGHGSLKQARSTAIAPRPIVLLTPPRVVVAVRYRILAAPPRLVEVLARSRAPPLELVPVV